MSIVKRLTPYSGLKVLISGGAAGIGEVIAAAYLETGAKVHVCDVSEQAVLAFRERYPQALATQADVSSAAEVKRVFELQREWVNGLDVLINNAGIAGPTTGIEKITEDEWEQSININLNAQYRFAHHAVPLLAESAHAHIIHISSVAGRLGYAWRTPYAATKWAIIGLMKSLAAELGDRDIRVNALLPGIIEGPRQDRVIRDRAKQLGISEPEMLQQTLNKISLGRMTPPDDVAAMALFLCSPAAQNITGQAISIDGNVEYL
ncbi:MULTISPECIES: SDR family oxidoreductase [unclassified Pseudomonas]|uniref:SDR family oxidoreductase n=1 Tax=unclassified Pseudomonas TaxID=196821 RepID=UPI001294EF79|nr:MULTISPECIES: SDR family oxidoreductase [unclassified Pseudomonas]MQT43175.1 SDR family oxidoreductase [Pseudomonas sp. FSL R10-0765]MQT53914.1 SDR family oxidoreductase [Pseudomonas sp. FSL R10-2398]MQU03666.1 SDR family oxidoreductase [Pseudomonas sp. FSL R10-2245]MQU14272.1 SDR family oxidoreductase [Pseudomonas sp. FSL R10-2189]MQU38632.1 SDR family oxidoreductase [Pseudomonas sp. FSL R10-2172]